MRGWRRTGPGEERWIRVGVCDPMSKRWGDEGMKGEEAPGGSWRSSWSYALVKAGGGGISGTSIGLVLR